MPSGGPRSNCEPFSTFYWAAQHLFWAVFVAAVGCAQTKATVTTILIVLFNVNTGLMLSL